MADLYANENFPRQVVDRLRALGHDVVTVQEAGNGGRGVPDDEVVRFAHERGRAVVTLNRKDFRDLHEQDGNHSGIIICTTDSDTDRQAQRIHDAIGNEGPLAGKLVRVNRPPA